MLKSLKTKKIWQWLHTGIAERGLSLCLLGVCAFAFVRYGHLAYAALLVIFYVLLMIRRLRVFPLVAAGVIIAILLNQPIRETYLKIYQANSGMAAQLSYRLAVIFEPNSGQEVLPATVRTIQKLIQAHQLTRYRLADSYRHDTAINQRTIEFVWPVRLDDQSPYIFFPKKELSQYPACQKIDELEGVALGYCH